LGLPFGRTWACPLAVRSGCARPSRCLLIDRRRLAADKSLSRAPHAPRRGWMDLLQVPLRFTCSYQDRRVLRTLEAAELPRLSSRGIRSTSDLGGGLPPTNRPSLLTELQYPYCWRLLQTFRSYGAESPFRTTYPTIIKKGKVISLKLLPLRTLRLRCFASFAFFSSV